MINDAFISYSTKDSALAFRIYNDLIRSGVKAYLYERDGEDGANFRNEIYGVIDKVGAFCLVDSSSSRISPWVKLECARIKRRLTIENDSRPKFIPLLAEKADANDPEGWFSKNIFYEEQPLIRGIDFSGLDRLDYRDKYKLSIVKLCKLLEIEYREWSSMPRDQDFEKELLYYGNKEEINEFLKWDYRNFLLSTDKPFLDPLTRIELLINACNFLHTPIISCSLAKGKILADSYKDEIAVDFFKDLTERFSDDPRSWAGLSAACYYTRHYKEALSAIDVVNTIIAENPDNNKMKIHSHEMIFNKIRILIGDERYDQALGVFNGQSEDVKGLPELLIAELELGLKLNAEFKVMKYALLTRYYDFKANSASLNSLIGDIEYQLGYFFNAKGNLAKAIEHYEIAAKAVPQSLQYHAELLLLYTSVHQVTGKRFPNQTAIRDGGLKIKPISAIDYYYLGMLNYFNNDIENARKNYTIYWEKNTLRPNWDFYDKRLQVDAEPPVREEYSQTSKSVLNKMKLGLQKLIKA